MEVSCTERIDTYLSSRVILASSGVGHIMSAVRASSSMNDHSRQPVLQAWPTAPRPHQLLGQTGRQVLFRKREVGGIAHGSMNLQNGHDTSIKVDHKHVNTE